MPQYLYDTMGNIIGVDPSSVGQPARPPMSYRDQMRNLARSMIPAGLLAGSFAPGAAVADATGYYPNAEGGRDPSMRQNIRDGNYLDTAFQGLGLLGDATYAIPAAGAVVGPTVGSLLKAPGAIAKASKAGKTATKAAEAPTTRHLFDDGWYHGSTGDIREFRPDLLGEATGANSAKEGFFFARDPIAPPKEFTQKSSDPEVIDMLKRMGKSDEEIAQLNSVSLVGNGAHTASGYAQLGGAREYREAMRRASIAEKNKNWPEYEKQVQIAEDFEIGRMNEAQALTARHGDARDQMLADVRDSFYNKPLSQKDAEEADKLFKKLTPYGWYNDPAKVDAVKKHLATAGGGPAIKSINNFRAVTAERLAQEAQSGANVMPVALRYKNPMVHDFKGSAYRDESYADLVKQAKRNGNDALILRNTFDPGAGTAKLVDVGVMFDPAQIRSKFAKFDPAKINSPDILAAGVPLGLLAGAEEVIKPPEKKKEKKPEKK